MKLSELVAVEPGLERRSSVSPGDAGRRQAEAAEGGARGAPAMTCGGTIPLVVLAAVLALVAVAAVLAWRQYDDTRQAALNELRAKVAIGAATLNAYFRAISRR